MRRDIAILSEEQVTNGPTWKGSPNMWLIYNNPVDREDHGKRVRVWHIFRDGEIAVVQFEGSDVEEQIPLSALA